MSEAGHDARPTPRILVAVGIAVGLALTLAGCTAAATGAPASTPPALAAPPANRPAGCEAVSRAYSAVTRLRSQRTAKRVDVMEPSNPQGMKTELSALAAAARAARTEDAEMATLLHDMDARFVIMAGLVGDFIESRAASREDAARTAIAELLRVAGESDDLLAASHRRCDGESAVNPVTGRLPPALIQKIVRARNGEYRSCYERGLRRDPKLEGRVAVHFVINRDGHVSDVGDAYLAPPDPLGWISTEKDETPPAPPLPRMPDARVTSCVVEAFRKLSFPSPDGGIVTVTYPIMFAPGK